MIATYPRVWLIALALELTFFPLHRAKAEERDAAAAEALFQEARALMASKAYDQACAKFAASQKLAPGGGTLLNLADCYEHAGKTATAWGTYHDAIAAAQRAGLKEREQLARESAKALEPMLPKVTLRLTGSREDIAIARDGIPLDVAMLGTPIPVDPGAHTFEARAPGNKTWSARIEILPAQAISLDVPELAPDSTRDDPAAPRAPEAPRAGMSGQRVVALTVVGLGVAGLAVGTIFGFQTKSKWSAAEKHCDGRFCDPEGVSLAADAKTNGNVSTVAFAIGGVALVAGGVLWFLAPSTSPAPSVSLAPEIGAGRGGVSVRGRF
jgi:hypothetical protein